MVHLVFTEREREDLARSLEAVGRQRALCLIQGRKTLVRRMTVGNRA
jgi:hypothetical protein